MAEAARRLNPCPGGGRAADQDAREGHRHPAPVSLRPNGQADESGRGHPWPGAKFHQRGARSQVRSQQRHDRGRAAIGCCPDNTLRRSPGCSERCGEGSSSNADSHRSRRVIRAIPPGLEWGRSTLRVTSEVDLRDLEGLAWRVLREEPFVVLTPASLPRRHPHAILAQESRSFDWTEERLCRAAHRRLPPQIGNSAEGAVRTRWARGHCGDGRPRVGRLVVAGLGAPVARRPDAAKAATARSIVRTARRPAVEQGIAAYRAGQCVSRAGTASDGPRTPIGHGKARRDKPSVMRERTVALAMCGCPSKPDG